MKVLMSDDPVRDHIYKQYDGKYIMVLELAMTFEENWFVVYRNLADDESFPNTALPIETWFASVNVDGEDKQRFTEIDPEIEFA